MRAVPNRENAVLAGGEKLGCEANLTNSALAWFYNSGPL